MPPWPTLTLWTLAWLSDDDVRLGDSVILVQHKPSARERSSNSIIIDPSPRFALSHKVNSSDFAAPPPLPISQRRQQQEYRMASNNWHAGASAFDASSAAIVQQSPVLQTLPGHASPDGDDSISRKRKRSSAASEHGGRGSVDSSLVGSPLTGKHRHQPGVKRACNDCRQQKVCERGIVGQ